MKRKNSSALLSGFPVHGYQKAGVRAKRLGIGYTDVRVLGKFGQASLVEFSSVGGEHRKSQFGGQRRVLT